MGVETALLFCAIRAVETLGTLSFTRDTNDLDVQVSVLDDTIVVTMPRENSAG